MARMSGHFELPAMDPNAAQTGVGGAVGFRAGLDGDQIGATTSVEMREALLVAEKGLDIGCMMTFSAKLGST